MTVRQATTCNLPALAPRSGRSRACMHAFLERLRAAHLCRSFRYFLADTTCTLLSAFTASHQRITCATSSAVSSST